MAGKKTTPAKKAENKIPEFPCLDDGRFVYNYGGGEIRIGGSYPDKNGTLLQDASPEDQVEVKKLLGL